MKGSPCTRYSTGHLANGPLLALDGTSGAADRQCTGRQMSDMTGESVTAIQTNQIPVGGILAVYRTRIERDALQIEV
jgi:hypothetical protein